MKHIVNNLSLLLSIPGFGQNYFVDRFICLMAAGSFLSMGYGFVEFKNRKEALNAVKQLQVLFNKPL